MTWLKVAVPVCLLYLGLSSKGPAPASQVIWLNCRSGSPVLGSGPMPMRPVGTAISRSGSVTWYVPRAAEARACVTAMAPDATTSTATVNHATRRGVPARTARNPATGTRQALNARPPDPARHANGGTGVWQPGLHGGMEVVHSARARGQRTRS